MCPLVADLTDETQNHCLALVPSKNLFKYALLFGFEDNMKARGHSIPLTSILLVRMSAHWNQHIRNRSDDLV